MKILWFTNTPCSAIEKLNYEFNRGGWLSSLERALSERSNIELHIAFYYGKQIDPFKHNNTWFYPVFRRNKGSKTERYLSRILRRSNNDQVELIQLRDVVSNVKPDVIHVHGTEDNFGLIQFHTTMPVVISMQGIANPYYEKFYAGVTASIASKYESIKSKLTMTNFRNRYYDFKLMAKREQEILNGAKNIIGRTDWDRQVTRIMAPNSTYFVGEEMLRDSFYNAKWQKKEKGKTLRILTISGDGLYKGFETIVKTAKLLSANPNFSFEWQVVGLNNRSKVVQIIQKWLKVDLNNININLLGEKEEKDIVNILLNSDIYCQVSHIENSPNSLCEAMMLGLPIVASYAGGTSSLLENIQEGILIQDGDSFVLSGSIVELSADFSRAMLLGQAARERALKRHNKKNIVDELINTYTNILNIPSK